MLNTKPVKYIAYLVLVALLFLLPLAIRDTYTLHLLCYIALNIIFAGSLRLIMAVGELSLAHAAFMGIGAYASALLTLRLDLQFLLALPLSGIIAAVIAYPIGLITLRLKGAYFLLITFAFAEVIRIILSNYWIGIFGGVPGITGIPAPVISFGTLLHFELSSKIQYYYLALVLMLLSVFAMRRLEKSRIGLVFDAIREEEILAESVGINRMRQKVLAFVIACFFAGIAGCYYAHFLHIITPHDFALHAILLPSAYVIIGGMGTIAGPVVGTTVLMLVSNFVLQEFGYYEMLIYGVLMVLVIILVPQGLISLPARIHSLVNRSTRQEN